MNDSKQKQPEVKLDFRKVLPVFIIVLVDLLGLTVIIPLLPLYATAFGANAFTIGLLGASYPLLQFIGAPLLGRLSDRYGRKPILLISQAGTLAGFLVLGWASALPLLFLARIIDGISGANISTAQAVISDITTKETRTQGLGLLGAAFGIGFIVGPVIAFISLIASGNNYHVPAFVAAGFSAASILLTWFTLEETLPHGESQPSDPMDESGFTVRAMVKALARPAVGTLLMLMFAQQIAFGGFEQLLALFTLNRLGMNASSNAVVFVFVGVIVVAVQGKFIGPWSRRFGDRRLVQAGLATLALGLTLTALTPESPVPWYSKSGLKQELAASGDVQAQASAGSAVVSIQLPDEAQRGALGLAWILVAMIPASIGGGLLQPSINSLITQHGSAAETGALLGLSASFMSAANALAPALGGAVFERLGASAPFLLFGLIMAALFVWALKGVPSVASDTPEPSQSAAD
jgi:DHA1 family tetracycline resistance protein-like MFS transporter